jgi:hypothetical protein
MSIYFSAIVTVCEIFGLFFLSRMLTRTISHLIHSFTGSTKSIVYGVAFLFLPGTLIHELAHFFMAKQGSEGNAGKVHRDEKNSMKSVSVNVRCGPSGVRKVSPFSGIPGG